MTKRKKRRWDPAATAAELAKENCRAKQGRKDKTDRGWMKNIKWITNSGTKHQRLGGKALWEIRFYQKSTVLLNRSLTSFVFILESTESC